MFHGWQATRGEEGEQMGCKLCRRKSPREELFIDTPKNKRGKRTGGSRWMVHRLCMSVGVTCSTHEIRRLPESTNMVSNEPRKPLCTHLGQPSVLSLL